MDPQALVFVFLFAGILLIFAELFIPSGGAIGVLCLCCFLISGYFAYKAWYISSPLYWWIYLGAVAVIVPSSIIGGFQILTRTSLGNRVLLVAPTEKEVLPYQEEAERLKGLIGKQGIALNPMTPGGLVSVNGERIHAISDGLPIEPNAPVEVIAVRGTRIVVRMLPPAEQVDEFTRLAEEADQGMREIDPWQIDDPESTTKS